MQPQTLDKRVERLEKRVTTLEQLPARVDELAGQILQLRTEMRGEFSAVREEIRIVRDQLTDQFSGQLRLTADQLMAHARTLHEGVLSRIALIDEGRRSRKKTR